MSTFQVIYVTRNPRDCFVSFFNHIRAMKGYAGSLQLCADAFLRDECVYWTPFMQNVLSYWDKRHEPNITFITYEDMKRDLPKVIREVSSFLGKPVAEKDIPVLSEFLSFENMRATPSMNKQKMVNVSAYEQWTKLRLTLKLLGATKCLNKGGEQVS